MFFYTSRVINCLTLCFVAAFQQQRSCRFSFLKTFDGKTEQLFSFLFFFWYCRCCGILSQHKTLLPRAHCSSINFPSVAGDILTNVLQQQPVELRAREVQGYLSRPGRNDGRGNGQPGRKACGQARDEKTQRLSWKHWGLEGVQRQREKDESGIVGEQTDWKTHLLSVWHSNAHKSSLAWRTIWNQNRRPSKWRTLKGMK